MSSNMHASIILDCADLYGEELTRERLDAYIRLLSDLSEEVLQGAVDAHCNDPDRGRFFPRPADIRAKCRRPGSEHPPVDAAWALALESLDEDASIVWTDLIEQARAVALPVWNSGDRIGARMAFKAAYQQMIERSTRPPCWKLSAGFDPATRVAAVERARSAGLIGDEQVRHLLPDLVPATGAVARIAGLLAGNVRQFPQTGSDDEVRARNLRNIRAIIEAANAETPRRRAERERRERIDAKKVKAKRALGKMAQDAAGSRVTVLEDNTQGNTKAR